jgi:dihydrofolate synthase / folylpolyglutamate synthase
MNIKAVKTKLVSLGDSVNELIAQHIPSLPERSVIAVASKIIAYEQRQWVKRDDQDLNQKHKLVAQQADRYLPPQTSKYQLMLAIKNNTLTVNAGIDESNAAGGYVLWPKDIQLAANTIWQFLRSHYGVKEVGVVITDSKTAPLRWGVTGTCLAHSGFEALHSYIGEQDLFGRPIIMEKINIAEAVAISTTLVMGEVAESQPLAIASDIPHIVFQDHEPTAQELAELVINIEDDVYGPLLTAVEWQGGDKD